MNKTLLILSGGKSQRMGEDKALLELHGKTLLQYQVERFAAEGFDVVTGLVDRFASFQGPLAGIDAALEYKPEVNEWFVLPVDMPALSPSTLLTLASDESEVTMQYFADHPMPFWFRNSERLQETIKVWLSNPAGARSIKDLFLAFRANAIRFSGQPNELLNLNLPEQWQEFLQGELTA